MSQPEQIITLKDVYREVVSLSGRMAAVDERQYQADRDVADHETRIRALERWRYALPLSTLLAGGSMAAAVAALYH